MEGGERTEAGRTDLDEARAELIRLRSRVRSLARDSGLEIMAAGTHPSASWEQQEITPLARYRGIQEDMAELAQRMLIFGLHVHVGIEDREFLVDAMNVARYFLPLALSYLRDRRRFLLFGSSREVSPARRRRRAPAVRRHVQPHARRDRHHPPLHAAGGGDPHRHQRPDVRRRHHGPHAGGREGRADRLHGGDGPGPSRGHEGGPEGRHRGQQGRCTEVPGEEAEL